MENYKFSKQSSRLLTPELRISPLNSTDRSILFSRLPKRNKLKQAKSKKNIRLEENESNGDNKLLPGQKFRRKARAILLVVRVAHAVRDKAEINIMRETWFPFTGIPITERIGAQQVPTSGRIYYRRSSVNPDELLSLRFDKNDFVSSPNEEEIASSVREILKKIPENRSYKQVKQVIFYLRKRYEAFRQYSFDVQKELCMCAYYDTFAPRRVLLKRGLRPDGLYILLSGLVAINDLELGEIRVESSGKKLGEEDLLSDKPRKNTIVAKTTVELLYVHKFDYLRLFSKHGKEEGENRHISYSVCKLNNVLMHFPMNLLEESPGSWTTVKFRYGQLMVRDSNEMDWVYVITSGEARVLKRMEVPFVNIEERRKKVQEKLEALSPLKEKKDLLKFVGNDRKSVSQYRKGLYFPPTSARGPSVSSSYSIRHLSSSLSRDSAPRSATERSRDICTPNENSNAEFPDLKLTNRISNSRDHTKSLDFSKTFIIEDESPDFQDAGLNVIHSGPNAMSQLHEPLQRRAQSVTFSKCNGLFLKTGRLKLSKSASSKKKMVPVPPFVQVDCLSIGKAFGFRQCLDRELWGPTASLVSAECEALLISRRFFMKHSNDTVNNLIRMTCKAYPSPEELLDRLDANMQWTDYKNNIIHDLESKQNSFRYRRYECR